MLIGEALVLRHRHQDMDIAGRAVAVTPGGTTTARGPRATSAG